MQWPRNSGLPQVLVHHKFVHSFRLMTFTWTHSYSYLLRVKVFFTGTPMLFTSLMTRDSHASSIALVSCKDMKTNIPAVVELARCL